MIEFALLFEEIQDTTTRINENITINGEEENCEEQQQELVTQLVTVSNANSLICFSLPSSSQRTFPQNAACTGVVADANVASRNGLSTADCQQNYLDRMSIPERQQQQRDRDHELHAEARAWLID
jgi:hypothetical protein